MSIPHFLKFIYNFLSNYFVTVSLGNCFPCFISGFIIIFIPSSGITYINDISFSWVTMDTKTSLYFSPTFPPQVCLQFHPEQFRQCEILMLYSLVHQSVHHLHHHTNLLYHQNTVLHKHNPHLCHSLISHNSS